MMGLEPTTFCMATRPRTFTSCRLVPAHAGLKLDCAALGLQGSGSRRHRAEAIRLQDAWRRLSTTNRLAQSRGDSAHVTAASISAPAIRIAVGAGQTSP